MTREFDLWEEARDDYEAGRAQEAFDLGLDLEMGRIDSGPPLETCPVHGLFEFTIWDQCPGCEADQIAAFEASKDVFVRPSIPVRRNRNAA